MEFGSVEWARRADGGMANGERILELARGARGLVASRARHLGASLGLSPRAIGGALADLRAPRCSLARAAEEALAATPRWIVAHSMRTWAFGALLARRDGVTLDEDVFFAASTLHDLGLATAAGATCFAHRGAELARQVGLAAGADAAACDRIADAVCMHLNVVPSGAPEARYVRIGAGYDVVADRFEHVSPQTRGEIVREWPREGFAAAVREALAREARLHPSTRIAFHCGVLGFPRLIAQADRRFRARTSAR